MNADSLVLTTAIVTLIVIGIAIFIHCRICLKFSRIAADKGYTDEAIFVWCFFFGLVGYLMVCAMPDKSQRMLQ